MNMTSITTFNIHNQTLTPALLWHKDIAQGTLCLYGIRVPYNRFFPCMEATPNMIFLCMEVILMTLILNIYQNV